MLMLKILPNDAVERCEMSHCALCCVCNAEATGPLQHQFISISLFQKLMYKSITEFAVKRHCYAYQSSVNGWFCISFCVID